MDVPPDLIHGFFQCISSDGTLKWNPATIHHDLINCSQNTCLNFVILGLSLENSYGRLYKKIRKKRTYNNAEKPCPVSTGILPHSLPEWAFRARPGLWRICLCPKVARIAEHKFGSR